MKNKFKVWRITNGEEVSPIYKLNLDTDNGFFTDREFRRLVKGKPVLHDRKMHNGDKVTFVFYLDHDYWNLATY